MISFDQYIQTGEPIDIRKGGRFNQSVILTFDDKTEWILLNNKPKERFCGFLFLKNALETAQLNNIKAAENRVALIDREIVYLSEYCGENRPDLMGCPEQEMLRQVGFTDTAGSANLRYVGKEVRVFDTEKGSFHPSVHEKIDAYLEKVNQIVSQIQPSKN